jgi:hypothetical protein
MQRKWLYPEKVAAIPAGQHSVNTRADLEVTEKQNLLSVPQIELQFLCPLDHSLVTVLTELSQFLPTIINNSLYIK